MKAGGKRSGDKDEGVEKGSSPLIHTCMMEKQIPLPVFGTLPSTGVYVHVCNPSNACETSPVVF